LFPGRKEFAVLLGNRELAIQVLKKSTTFFTDGTFSVTPSHVDALQVRSSQVLNVLADYQGTSVSELNRSSIWCTKNANDTEKIFRSIIGWLLEAFTFHLGT
jgi:hypothetical protein